MAELLRLGNIPGAGGHMPKDKLGSPSTDSDEGGNDNGGGGGARGGVVEAAAVAESTQDLVNGVGGLLMAGEQDEFDGPALQNGEHCV